MEKQKHYQDDLSHIRQMMERSSRFVSLSGFSGVLVGAYALVGAYLAYRSFYFSDELIYGTLQKGVITVNVQKLVLIALAVLVLALSTAVGLSVRKAKRKNLPLWDNTARLLFINLFIPLVAGGIFVLILLSKGALGLVAPVTLIFYGLGLVNASKHTYADIRILGLAEITLGLIGSYFIGYGLLFWAIGFGVLHIVYGLWMYFKYER